MVATTATQSLTDLAGAAPDASRGTPASSPSTQPSSLPCLPTPDESLITRLFERKGLTLETLFESLTKEPIEGAPTTILNFYRWTKREDIHSWLDFHTALENERRAEADYAKRTLALNSLEQVLKETADLIEKRRASSAILRTLNRTGLGALRGSTPLGGTPLGGTPLRGVRNSPSSPRGGGGGGRAEAGGGSVSTQSTSTPSSAHSTSSASSYSSSDPPKPKFAPVHLYPTEHQRHLFSALMAGGVGKVPQPPSAWLASTNNEPQHAVHFVMNALRGMTEPDQITLFNFSGNPNRSLESLEAFKPRIEKLFPTRFKSWEKLSITQTSDHTFTAEILITNHDDSTKPLTLRFERPTTGPLIYCWHLKLSDTS